MLEVIALVAAYCEIRDDLNSVTTEIHAVNT